MGNWQNILVLVLTALTTHQATFPLTLGGEHFLVSITQTPTSGGTKWWDIFQVVSRIVSGSQGQFTVGVFSVNVQPLTLGTPVAGAVGGVAGAFTPGASAPRPPGANGT